MFAGNDVVILQNLLLRSPFVKPIDTTGIYDNNTAHAVASYQNGNHLRRYSNNLRTLILCPMHRMRLLLKPSALGLLTVT